MRSLFVPILFFFLLMYCPSHAQNYAWAKHFNPSTAILAEGRVITHDAAGNIYIAGKYEGVTDFDPGPGVFNLTATGTAVDAFICKLDAAGNLVWAKRLGGLGTMSLFAMTVGADGSVYSTGGFNGNNIDFDPGAGVFNISSNGTSDIFISKLSASGNFVWAKSVGSTSIDEGRGIAVDGSNNVYVTGSYNATIDIDPGPGVVNFISASGDGFVLKLDQAGSYVNAYRITTAGLDIPYAMVYKNGLIYVTTYMDIKAAITKFDLNLNVIWQKITQGTGNVWPQSITVDNAGNTIISGSFSGTSDFDPGPGFVNVTAGGSTDMFIMKLDAEGILKWVRFTAGTSAALVAATGLAADKDGSIYVAGKFGNGYQFEPGNNNSTLTPQNRDIFVMKLNSYGGFQWVIKMGGANNDVGNAISVDDNDNVFTTGYFINTADFNPDPLVSNTLTSFAGAGAVFVSQLSRTNHISGNAFIDVNNDGIRQSTESPFPYRVIKAQTNALEFFGIADTDGQYDMYVDTGNYTISLPYVPPYYTSTVATHTATFNTAIGGYDSLNNFPVFPTPGMNDLSVNVYSSGRPRPGSNVMEVISYRNTGTTTLTGSVTLRHASALVYQQSSPVATTYSNPLLTWNFTNLKPFESGTIYVTFSVPTTVTGGTVLNNLATIYPVAGDQTTSNNQDSALSTVVASYDPNDKSVAPAGPVSTTFIAAPSTYLDYIVRFQNTGTDTAFLVVITDTLQNTLDIKTLKIMGSSHPFSVGMEKGNMLRFTFDNILLPDSTTNELLSHGFIAFRIKPFTTLTAGTFIRNKASIFFDYNSAVTTNETETQILSVLPISLTDFDITVAADCKQVLVKWSTAYEINNSFFTIEKSYDAINWLTVTTINGAMNTGTATHYSYKDISPVAGTVYYRLKQTDSDGRSTHSLTRRVSCNDKDQFVKIYPNPVQDMLSIETGRSFEYFLYDTKGTLVKTATSSTGFTKLDLTGFSKGMYLVKIKTVNGISYHKILLQ